MLLEFGQFRLSTAAAFGATLLLLTATALPLLALTVQFIERSHFGEVHVANVAPDFAVRSNVVDDGILHVWTDAGGHAIEAEQVADPPSDVMIGARAVSTDAERSGNAAPIIEC